MRTPSAPALTILDALDPALFGPWFDPVDSWRAWLVFLRALFGLPMTEPEKVVFQRYTGRASAPTSPAKEAILCCGRRAGKSLVSSVIACYLAAFREYESILAPGEKGTVMLLAADRRQARVLMRYVAGLLDGVPMLARMVVNRTSDSITLSNRITIEIHTASFRAVRGYTVVAAICDEIAFWHSEESANPDHEILKALRPAMAAVPGAVLLAISSPYARKGVLWEEHEAHYGKNDDPVLVWQADTRSMNPSVPQEFIDAEYEKDPSSAASEYGAQFRTDIEAFVSKEAVDGVVVKERTELPPKDGIRYFGFVDPSGGSQDSMTLAIAHREGRRVILDATRERKPPFSPEAVTEEFVGLLKSYGIARVTGDYYGGEWPREQFRKHGVSYDLSERSKSDLYRELLPLINSQKVELLDQKGLVSQLLNLERRTSRQGKDSISHPPSGHDDIINAAAGALVMSVGRRKMLEGYTATMPKPEPALPFYWQHSCGTQRLIDPSRETEPYPCLHCSPGWSWQSVRHR